MKKTLITAAFVTASTLSASAQQRSLTPDEVAMIVGTLVVQQQQQCAMKPNDFPLNVAVAKLGQDLVDFTPGNRYAPLVEVKMKKAIEFVGMVGKQGACAGFEETLVKFIPDVYVASPKGPAKK